MRASDADGESDQTERHTYLLDSVSRVGTGVGWMCPTIGGE